MRIAIAVNHYPPAFGGHGIQIARNLPYLRERGIEVEVVTRASPGLRGTTTENDTVVHRVLTPGDTPGPRLRRIGELRAHLRSKRGHYALLHSTVLGWELFANAGVAQRLGIPVIVELIRLGGDDPVALSRQRLGALKLRALRSVAAWIAISESFRDHLDPIAIAPDDLTVIPTGVDLHEHGPIHGPRRNEERSRLGLPAEGRIVASVGSLVHRKGFDRVLEAWARLGPRRGRDLLVVIGPATAEEGLSPEEPQTVEHLNRRARAPDLDGTVRFTGRVDDVARWLAVADAFVLLSRHEGLGTVILEAMASSLACVVSPLDGVAAEIVDDGRSGLIAPDPDDPGAVAAHLAALLDDADRRGAIGDAAREQVQARFSLDARADALADLYNRIAKS